MSNVQLLQEFLSIAMQHTAAEGTAFVPSAYRVYLETGNKLENLAQEILNRMEDQDAVN